jgi:multisubunit Na+/H+ antiporter MnhG subunit
MNVRVVVVDILLGLAVVIVLASTVGLLLMRDVYQRIHFLTPIALLAPIVVGLAMLVQAGWSAKTAITWLTVLFLAIAGPYLAHATMRAARIREKGDWRPGHDRRAGARAGSREDRS